jgi:hypothetical protein
MLDQSLFDNLWVLAKLHLQFQLHCCLRYGELEGSLCPVLCAARLPSDDSCCYRIVEEANFGFLLFSKLTVIIPFGVGHLLVFTAPSDPFSVCMYGSSSKWYSYNIIPHQKQR